MKNGIKIIATVLIILAIQAIIIIFSLNDRKEDFIFKADNMPMKRNETFSLENSDTLYIVYKNNKKYELFTKQLKSEKELLKYKSKPSDSICLEKIIL